MKRLIQSLVAASALTLVGGSGCTSPEPSPWVRPRRAEPSSSDAAQRPALDLHVEYAGCSTVVLSEQGQLECVYEPGATLRLWVVHEQGQTPTFSMEGDGEWSVGEPYVLAEELGQGYRLKLEGEGLGAVTVQLPERPKWRLVLRAEGELSDAEREDIAGLRNRFIELERKLDVNDFKVMPRVHEVLDEMVERGHVWSAIQSSAAAAYLLTWELGRPQIAEDVLLGVRRRLEKQVPDLAESYPFAAAACSIYLAHTLRRRGQLARAASEYRAGSRVARRLDQRSLVMDAMAPYALVLAELGYFEAAAYWSAEVRDLALEHGTSHELGQILTMVAKVSLRLRQAHQVYDDPGPRLEQVQFIYGPDGPLAERPEPFESSLSRAELALMNHEPDVAINIVERTSKEKLLSVDRYARLEELRLRGLLMRNEDSLTLHRAFHRLQSLAAEAVGPEFRWKIATLEARVYEKTGVYQDALEAYEHSEEMLDQLLPLAALGLPGDFAAARYGESTGRLVSLLLRHGESQRAVCTIRRSRARVNWLAMLAFRFGRDSGGSLSKPIEKYTEALREYEESLRASDVLASSDRERIHLEAMKRRQDLEAMTFEILTMVDSDRRSPECDQLTPRQPGEVLLLLYPIGEDLHLLVEDGGGAAHVASLGGYFSGTRTSDDWSSDLLLHPIHQQIDDAERVRVLASGRANSIPIHALPWSPDPHADDSERLPLMAYKPVVYGVDLPPVSSPEVSASRALVLTDDRADGAEQEGTRVAAALRGGGWSVEEVSGRDLVVSRLKASLERADHFHYAGHVYYAENVQAAHIDDANHEDRVRRWPPYSGGAASEPSYIPLGQHGRLTVSDILLFQRVPQRVVLMGCDSGIVDDRTSYGGFSLATAFLAAGSQSVIASTQKVDGDEAFRLGRALYHARTSEGPADLGRQMTDTTNYLHAQNDDLIGVQNYRVYVR